MLTHSLTHSLHASLTRIAQTGAPRDPHPQHEPPDLSVRITLAVAMHVFQANTSGSSGGAGGGTRGFRSELPRVAPLGAVASVLAWVIGHVVMVRVCAAAWHSGLCSSFPVSTLPIHNFLRCAMCIQVNRTTSLTCVPV